MQTQQRRTPGAPGYLNQELSCYEATVLSIDTFKIQTIASTVSNISTQTPHPLLFDQAAFKSKGMELTHSI